MNRKYEKFTIVELLVTIAVIAILASLLLPALNKALEKGRTILCTSNQKQIGTALHMYAQDFHDVITLYNSYDKKTSGTTPVTYAHLLSSKHRKFYGQDSTIAVATNYLDSKDIFRCPNIQPFVTPPKTGFCGGPNATDLDAGKNHLILYGTITNAKNHPLTRLDKDSAPFIDEKKPDKSFIAPLARIKSPSKFFALGDSYAKARDSQWYSISFKNASAGIMMSHNKRANILWIDGHVDSNSPADIIEKTRIIWSPTSVAQGGYFDQFMTFHKYF